MKKILNRILIIILSILLLISSILVTDTNQYYKYIQYAAYLIAIIYLLIQMVIKKNIKIINNKLDIYIILLVLSSIIPVIFNTYVSLKESIKIFLEYTYFLSIYILARECIGNNTKLKSIISNVLIITAVIVTLIGIDEITTQKMFHFLENIKVGHFSNGEDRLISVFGYANVCAVYLASILFLNINQFINKNNKIIRAFYKTITLLLIIGIILTYSKSIFVILPLMLVIYIVKLKEQRADIISNITISLIMAIIYILGFDELFKTENFEGIWINLAIIIGISYILNLSLEKINKMIKFKRTTIIIIIIIIVILLFLTYIIVALNIPGEYKVFSSEIITNYDARTIRNIKGNEEYLFEFNIQAEVPENSQNTYKINIIERNIKNQSLVTNQIVFDKYDGTKQINIVTNEETSEIKIEFISKFKYGNESLVVKELKLNGKQIPLQYKYLPTKLVKKIQDISINYKTLQERIEMIKDSIKIAGENPLTGIGGEGWQYKYREVQSYAYSANNIHSYPAKILLEFGIVGIIAYIGLVINIIKLLIQSKDRDNIAILVAILVLSIHSIIDMDMDYTHILMYYFLLSGIIAKDIEEPKERMISINIIMLLLIITSIYLSINSSIYNKTIEIRDLEQKRNDIQLSNKTEESKEISKKIAEKYEDITKFEKYNYLEAYYNSTIFYIESECENVEEKLDEYYNKILNYENKKKYSIIEITKKIKMVNEIIQKLHKEAKYNQIIEKYIELVLNEYEETEKQLKECIESQHITDNVSIINLSNIYENIKEIKKYYLCDVRIYNEDNISIDEEELKNITVEKIVSILLYHTHGTESYKSEEQYETYDFYKTLDKEYNVIKVGNTLEQLLIEKGFSIIHNQDYNDLPTTTGAYGRVREKIKEEMLKNEEINLIIDLHRDSYIKQEHVAKTIQINQEEVAPLMFVIGVSEKDEEWLYDLKIAIEIQKIADKMYPGLFKPILIRKREYNQDLSKYSILIEVGENCNSIKEALNSMKYFSEILAEYQANV